MVFIGFLFLSQFWFLEVAVGKKPVMDALRSSINMVKNNVLGVFLYDIILFFAGIVVALPFIVIAFVLEMVFLVGIFAGMMMVPVGGIVAAI